jgi:hypothetical protein
LSPSLHGEDYAPVAGVCRDRLIVETVVAGDLADAPASRYQIVASCLTLFADVGAPKAPRLPRCQLLVNETAMHQISRFVGLQVVKPTDET